MSVAPRAAAARALDLAAVDLGSNSFHLMVARAHGNGAELQVIDRLREPIRLAAGLDADLRLTPDAQARALACLQRFGQRLAQLKPRHVRVVGTNTLRRLKSAKEFLTLAEAALGHRVEIIAGLEEARLVYGGVTHGLDASQPRRLVVDIGGGSTEVIIGHHATPQLMESVSLGCVTHQRRFFPDGELTRARFKKARLDSAMRLEFLERRYRKAGWDLAIGSSGTMRGVWRVMAAQGWCVDHMTRDGLEKVIELTLERGHSDRIDFDALREDRRPVFAGGLAVLAGVFDALQLKTMATSERALREGVIYDLLGRLSNRDVRGESVRALALRFGTDPQHAARVQQTALDLLAQVAEPWALDMGFGTQLLSWAAQLHEIGFVIAHSSYHKHGEYILRHGDLQGFSQTDQKLLAALIRLHRGKFTASTLEDLPDNVVEPLRRLAVLFRLAVLLHRSRAPEDDLAPKLNISRRQLELHFAQPGWLAQHPLTQADLEREADYLRALDLRLKFE